MLHPDTRLALVSEEVGWGVFAARDIPKGTITWAIDPLDQVFEERRAARLMPHCGEVLERFTWQNSRGQRILCWDFAKYMNHSCDPNTMGPGRFEIEIAIRDIAEGEQLTCEYGALNLEHAMTCRCGSPHCRGVIRDEDFELHADEWDQRIREAFPLVMSVEQKLWHLVSHQDRAISRAAANPRRLPSIIKHRLQPKMVASLGASARAGGIAQVGG